MVLDHATAARSLQAAGQLKPISVRVSFTPWGSQLRESVTFGVFGIHLKGG